MSKESIKTKLSNLVTVFSRQPPGTYVVSADTKETDFPKDLTADEKVSVKAAVKLLAAKDALYVAGTFVVSENGVSLTYTGKSASVAAQSAARASNEPVTDYVR